MRPLLATLAIVMLAVVVTGVWAAEPAFVEVSQSAGVVEILQAKYAADPQWWLSGLHLVDLDGDGLLDLFFSSHAGGDAVATLGDGQFHFRRADGNWPTSEILLAYDRDEDGRLDLLMRHSDGGSQWWRNRSQPGRLVFEATGITRPGNTSRRQALVDINRDGRVDWLRGFGKGICFDLADGKGGFTSAPPAIAVDAGRGEMLCLPIDIDGDGDLDILSEWGQYEKVNSNCRVFRNKRTPHGPREEQRHAERDEYEDITTACGLRATGLSIKGAGDFNHDGAPDLLCIEDGTRFEIYLNDGRGRFTRRDGAIRGLKGKPHAPSWGIAVMTDFDNDGHADILVNGRCFLKILRGNGQGDFDYMNDAWGIVDLAAASVDDGHCFGDIDGDGRLDIVGYLTNGDRKRVGVYRNALPERSWLRVRLVGRPGNAGAAGAKVRLFARGDKKLLWYDQVAIYDSQAAMSYYAVKQTERHFGLGDRDTVDVSVEFYPSGTVWWARGVKANTTLVIREP